MSDDFLLSANAFSLGMIRFVHPACEKSVAGVRGYCSSLSVKLGCLLLSTTTFGGEGLIAD